MACSSTAHILPLLAVLRPTVLLKYSQYSQNEVKVLDTTSILETSVATPAAALAALATAPLAHLLLICRPL